MLSGRVPLYGSIELRKGAFKAAKRNHVVSARCKPVLDTFANHKIFIERVGGYLMVLFPIRFFGKA